MLYGQHHPSYQDADIIREMNADAYDLPDPCPECGECLSPSELTPEEDCVWVLECGHCGYEGPLN